MELLGLRFIRRRLRHLEHELFSLATLGTEACDTAGGAFRPQWREWPAKEFLGESRPNGILANAAASAVCITSELPVLVTSRTWAKGRYALLSLNQWRPLSGRREEPTRNVRGRLVTLLSVSSPLACERGDLVHTLGA